MYYERLDEDQTRELMEKYSRQDRHDALFAVPALIAGAAFVFGLLLLGF